jgi:23S rRNA (guanosine2251-2'-O)-methyltransferase
MRKLRNDELPRLTVNDFKAAEKIPLVVVLDNVRSSNNIGSIFRTSDAFLVGKIYLCGICGTPPDKEIHKTALGAEYSMDWEYCKTTEEIVIRLKNEGYTIIAIEQVEGSIPLRDYIPGVDEKVALIFGNEINGVQQEIIHLCDNTVEIPQFGTKHSFNIAVSAGIVLWEFFKKVKSLVKK